MKRLSLKWRVLVWIAIVHLLVMLGAGTVLILNARKAVQIEITAAQDSAVTLLECMGQDLTNTSDATAIATLAEQIVQPRHVRIRVLSPDGAPLPLGGETRAEAEGDYQGPPRFFTALVAPDVTVRSIPVVVGAGTLATIEVAAVPKDEIDEVWEDVSALGGCLADIRSGAAWRAGAPCGASADPSKRT